MQRKYKMDVFIGGWKGDEPDNYNVKFSCCWPMTHRPVHFHFHNRINNKRPEATAIKLYGDDYVLREDIRRVWRSFFHNARKEGMEFVGYSSGKQHNSKKEPFYKKQPDCFAIAMTDGTYIYVFAWLYGHEINPKPVSLLKPRGALYGSVICELEPDEEQEVSSNA